ncbi:FecCD family ABC transporter permease [Enterococcus sp. HY326]|uniref:FecCD family ABC transporter permease n=1 Tax=Enterococcus sp. HY326 TaxID=2971265 RepID=UPI0022407769|nr:iron ABC transporter permease [Enterococcus sp. HY326]
MSRRINWRLLLFFSLMLMVVVFLISLRFGASQVNTTTIVKSFLNFDSGIQQELIIRDIRLPRTLAAFLVGTCLAVAGAMMQGATRNLLADSGLLGINAGAALSMALVFAFFSRSNYLVISLAAFFGAALATGLVYLVTRYAKGGMSPLRLILAGTAINSLLTSLSQAISLSFNLSQDLAFWFVGGAANVTWAQLKIVGPIFFVALIASFFIAPSITLLSMGDETAISLGKNPSRIRGLTMVVVLFLAGIAVSLVGSVSFIGLIVPHFVRSLVGYDYRLVIPFSAIFGGLLVTIADVCARMVNPPFETPFGILVALIGVPFLLYLVWRES